MRKLLILLVIGFAIAKKEETKTSEKPDVGTVIGIDLGKYLLVNNSNWN